MNAGGNIPKSVPGASVEACANAEFHSWRMPIVYSMSGRHLFQSEMGRLKDVIGKVPSRGVVRRRRWPYYIRDRKKVVWPGEGCGRSDERNPS